MIQNFNNLDHINLRFYFYQTNSFDFLYWKKAYISYLKNYYINTVSKLKPKTQTHTEFFDNFCVFIYKQTSDKRIKYASSYRTRA